MRFHSQQILLYCLGQDQHTETKKKGPGRRQKWYRAAWSHIWIPALLEVDLEPRANRGVNRTKSLASLF